VMGTRHVFPDGSRLVKFFSRNTTLTEEVRRWRQEQAGRGDHFGGRVPGWIEGHFVLFTQTDFRNSTKFSQKFMINTCKSGTLILTCPPYKMPVNTRLLKLYLAFTILLLLNQVCGGRKNIAQRKARKGVGLKSNLWRPRSLWAGTACLRGCVPNIAVLVIFIWAGTAYMPILLFCILF
jgi:hypothetical protein